MSQADAANRATTAEFGGPELDEAFQCVERALTGIARLARPSRIFGALTDRLGRPLDRAAYAVLARLEQFGPIRLTDLAAAMEIDISTASRHVRSLVERGLLVRGHEPGDLRARRLELTAAGDDLLRRSRQARLTGIRARLGDWSAHDVGELARLLDQLLESFGAPVTNPDDTPAARPTPVTSART